MFQGVPMRFKVFQGVARYSEAFQGVKRWFMVFQGSSWCTKVFLVLARHYKYSQAFQVVPIYSEVFQYVQGCSPGIPRTFQGRSKTFHSHGTHWKTIECLGTPRKVFGTPLKAHGTMSPGFTCKCLVTTCNAPRKPLAALEHL